VERLGLPGSITTIVVTGTFLSPSGAAAAGTVSFTPSSTLTDLTGLTILTQEPLTATLNNAGSFTITLPCTNNSTLRPNPFYYLCTVSVPWAVQDQITFTLPSTLGDTVDISALVPIPVQAEAENGIYVSTVNGQSGSVSITGLPSGIGQTGQTLVAASSLLSAWQWPAPEWINVLNYGADPTGTTDSTTALQAAFDSGQPVYIPAGRYLVCTGGTPLAWRAGLVVRGDYAGSYPGEDTITGVTYLSRAAGANCDVIQAPDTVNYGRMQDIAIDGNKNNNTAGYGFNIVDGAAGQTCNIVLDRCFIHDNPYSNVYVGYNRDAVWIRNGIYNYAGLDGVTVAGPDCHISGNIVGHNGRGGVVLGTTASLQWGAAATSPQSVDVAHVIRNDIYQNLVGVSVASGSSNCMIQNNGIDRQYNEGISVYSGYSNSITGNALHSNGAAANDTYGHIHVGAGVDSVAVSDNTYGPQDSGYPNVAAYCVLTDPGITSGAITGNLGVADPSSYVTGILSTAGGNSSPSVVLSKGGGIIQAANSAQQVFQLRSAAGAVLFSMTNAGSFTVNDGAGQFVTAQNVFGASPSPAASTTLAAVSTATGVQPLALVESAGQTAPAWTLYASNGSTVLQQMDVTGAMPGLLLCTPTQYLPGSPVSFATTSTTYAAVSSANINTGTFTAPSSGAVLVTVSGILLTVSSDADYFGFALANHGSTTMVGYQQPFKVSVSSNVFPLVSMQFLVTGLSGSQNFDLMFAAGGSTGTPTLTVFTAANAATTSLASSIADIGSPIIMSVRAA
jgi:parallel beta-helix repeat protein